MIDLYCERSSEGLFAEPLNLITNIGFIAAAYFIYRFAKSKNNLTGEIIILISLVTAIGIGSALFHMFANKFTQLLDVIPIFLFQIIFLVVYLRRVANIKTWKVLLICAFFILLSAMFIQFPQLLNNSLSYIPALIFLNAVGLYHRKTAENQRSHIIVASMIFLISLIFRTADPLMCEHFSLGTHFIWHLLNSIVIVLIMQSLVTNKI